MVAPVCSASYAAFRQKFHLSPLCKFPEPPLFPSRAAQQAAARAIPKFDYVSNKEITPNKYIVSAAVYAARSAAHDAAYAYDAARTVDAALNATIVATLAVDDVAAARANEIAAWDRITHDAKLVEEFGAEKVSRMPLRTNSWPNQQMYMHWAELCIQLRKSGPIWIDWYERIINGRHVSREVEEAYVFLDDPELWKDPAKANAAIKATLDAIKERAKDQPTPEPALPPPGPGPDFEPTDDGFDVKQNRLPQNDLSDEHKRKLHAALLRHIKRLDEVKVRLGNTHKLLHDEYVDFAAFVSNALEDIDIPTLWSAGSALSDMVDRLEQQFERAKKNGNETALKELPDEMILSQLLAVTRDYAGFIMSFEQTQILVQNVREHANLNKSGEEQKDSISGVVKPMLATPNLLAHNAKRLFGMFDRAIDVVDEKTATFLAASTATTTRLLIALGQSVVRATPSSLRNTAGGIVAFDVAMKLSGNPNWEAVIAAMDYLRTNANALAVFANHDPVMKRWLEWVIDEIKRTEAEEKSKTNQAS